MRILGIESSCDETSASVVSADGDGKQLHILSNVVASQVETHRLYGGVVPEIAGRAHIEAVSGVVEEALQTAGVTMAEIDGVAATTHPGLIGALLVGVNFAKALAFSYAKPLVSVNHVHAHTAAAYLLETPPEPPFVSLVVSGGHTSFYLVKSYTEYEELGGTRDDAAGEAFDKIARVIGMPYPGGAAMDKLAFEGDARRKGHYVLLPSPAMPGDTPDFSFSGLKSAALNLLNGFRMKGEEPDLALFASEYVNKIADGIASKVKCAIRMTGCRSLVLAGGVAANGHLRAALEKESKKQGFSLYIPPVSLCGDNGAMVASQGVYEYLAGNFADSFLNASAED